MRARRVAIGTRHVCALVLGEQARLRERPERVPTARTCITARYSQAPNSDLHKRIGRPDLAEELALRSRRLLPSANVGQHEPGADHVSDGAASFLDCCAS